MKLTRKQRQAAHLAWIYAAAALVTVVSVFPFYNAIITSLQTGQDLFLPSYLPTSFHWENYATALVQNGVGRSLANSVLVATVTVGGCLLVSITGAFALARIRFRGQRALLFTILCVSMFPQVAVLSGLFELIRWLGLYNSLGSLILSYLIFTLPFTVWVLTTFMREMPRELEEAAMIDGATPWIVLTRVFLPIMGPAMATTGLLAFIAAWNEFLFALTFTLTDAMRTVPVAIALISGASSFELPWGRIMAASVIVTVPLILLVLVFQRRIVAGLTAGAVKG